MDELSATVTWRRALAAALSLGTETKQSSAGASFRGSTNRELVAHQTVWPMGRPAIACPGRRLGYKFMAAEAAWILSGDNLLATIKPYAKHMAEFSDDGRTLSGAYGPPFVDQAAWVARTLSADRASRQAVATIWRPRPGPSRDTPCTVAMQWLIRDGSIHCSTYMRSSDLWTGVPYDTFSFSMMSAYVAVAVDEYDRHRWKRGGAMTEPAAPAPAAPLRLGNLYLTAGSQHLYKQDFEEAAACSVRTDYLFEAEAVDPSRFATTADLVADLWRLAGAGGARP